MCVFYRDTHKQVKAVNTMNGRLSLASFYRTTSNNYYLYVKAADHSKTQHWLQKKVSVSTFNNMHDQKRWRILSNQNV